MEIRQGDLRLITWASRGTVLVEAEHFFRRRDDANTTIGLAQSITSVVISRLQKIDAPIADEVHDAVLLRKATRPQVRTEMLQWLRFAWAFERVPKNVLD